MLRGTTRQLFALSYRHFSAKTSLEQAVENKLKEKFSPSFLQVIDHSGEYLLISVYSFFWIINQSWKM